VGSGWTNATLRAATPTQRPSLICSSTRPATVAKKSSHHRSTATALRNHAPPCRLSNHASLSIAPPLRRPTSPSRPSSRSSFLSTAPPARRGLLHQSGELRATSELYTGELHAPTSLCWQAARRCCAKRACCKPMFQVF
jgi:hypothetical protein